MTNDQIRAGWESWQVQFGRRQRRHPKSYRWLLRLLGAFVCLLTVCITKPLSDRMVIWPCECPSYEKTLVSVGSHG